MNHVRPSRSTTTTAVARNKKPSAKTYETATNSKYSYENQYAKYYEAITNTNQPIATTTSTKPTKSSKTTQTFKQSKSGEFESSLKQQQQQPYQQHQRMPRSVRIKSEYSSKLINKSLSSDASKSRLTETNSCKSSCSSTKSSDRCGNTPDSAVEVLPPPPPPPPPIDLFKPIDNSFLFKRKKKMRKPLLVNDSVDEMASKSFDAVVDELKFKLEKMRTSDDNLSRLNTLLNKTNSSKPASSILVDTQVATLTARPALATVAKASEAETISTIYSSNFKAKTPITKQKLFPTEKSDMEKTQSNSSIFSASLKSIYTNNVTKDTHSKSLDTNSKLSGLSSCKNRNDSCSSFDSRDSSLQQPQPLQQQQISQPFKTPTNKTIKTNSVKFTDQQFKLEIYDSNGDESDDYTKYTRLKFTPTPNKIDVCTPAVKFIDEKINYTSNSNEYFSADPASSKSSSVNGAGSSKKADTAKKLEFFTQNLFVTHNKKTYCSSVAHPSCLAPTATAAATIAAENGEKNMSSKVDQYRNEFKETVKPMPVGQFFKIVKKQQPASNQPENNLVNEPAKSIAGAGAITGSDDMSSSGIDSSNYLNSDDDLNNNSSSNKSIIIKTSSLENFLIPSKFSSFTDYNVAKSRKLLSSIPINSSKNNVMQTAQNTPPDIGNSVICVNRDELPMTKLKTTLEFNNLSEYNKLCDQISDYVTLQNNYFGDTDGFELTTNDNQMLNKYLNEMTNYYQNLNSQELELANFNE